MKKFFAALILFGIMIVGSVESQVVSWTHVVQASEYTQAETADGKEYLIYTYYDDRFSTVDWFDTWIEDWAEQSGAWSDFAPTLDANLNMFLYDVMYNDGYVTWKTYTMDLNIMVGVQLKFFKLEVR
jgi:hypothetical protein